MNIYNPQTCVWEITMACNMRCKHCGSSCTEALPGELTTEEAFSFVDMCSEMEMQWISISGGEPFMRKDLLDIVKYAVNKDIGINIITNGWLITEKIAKTLSKLDIIRVMISLEGPNYIHNFMRKPGAFERAMNSFRLLYLNGVDTGCITTITKKNIEHLNELKYSLIGEKVGCWQVQIGFPMGNLSHHLDWVIDPEQINQIIDFCYETSQEGKIDIHPADCIGYYNDKQTQIYEKIYKTSHIEDWDGCNAGMYGFGILHNGDILGCTSMRDKSFIEGNIKKRTLKDIWYDPQAFAWRRFFKKENLKGDCLKCEYGEKCLGGCANSRLSINGSIYSENLYCTHNLLMKKKSEILSN